MLGSTSGCCQSGRQDERWRDFLKHFTMINEKDGKEVCAIVKLKAKINGHKATIAEDYQDLKEIVMDKRRRRNVAQVDSG